MNFFGKVQYCATFFFNSQIPHGKLLYMIRFQRCKIFLKQFMIEFISSANFPDKSKVCSIVKEIRIVMRLQPYFYKRNLLVYNKLHFSQHEQYSYS